MATRSEEFFHDQWLGMVQSESDGLVVAKPVLLAANVMNRQPPATQELLNELCPQEAEGAPRRIANLPEFFEELLDLDADLWESSSSIPDEVSLYAPEGPQTIRPTLGLLRQDDPKTKEGPASPASDAAAKYVALLWDVTAIEGDEGDVGEHNSVAIGLPLDKPETTTGDWSYPAAAKFDRLLRHCRVPVGVLTNREVIRLVYAPHGESSGHITFRIDDMATVGGRPILDAMIMLLCANQWFGVSDENALPSLLRRSREYQGTVTEDLAEQVFAGLEALLKGFQTAAERDKSGLLREALERDDNHLYHGLLTVMLRLVFILYAEDRGLLPVDHPHYAQNMSLLGLFERLQRDHGNFPDSMNNRFGAWGHIISLSRAIYLGVKHGDLHIPPRQGDLFDPHRYPFLEGWSGGSAPIVTQTARADVKVPTVDDGTVFALLRSLLIFQGQRLSYRTLDVEQIGSVYEALMGYQVSPCESPAVAIKIKSKRGAAKYWLEPEAVLARPARQRVSWLKDTCGFDTPIATKIKKALDDVGKEKDRDQNAMIEALLPLAAGKKGLAHEQLAIIGQYVLQPGSERRRSGTQYTPRSLTEPIVRKTLEPLIRSFGAEPTADQLLELKVCDPAMGSGAFLVECCRQLADEVVAAWGRANQIEEIAAVCPEGDVVAHARRFVAQRCLYGVDKNAMAVQLAKLSLWLFTLARELPFTFMDHSFRHGDSLVGLDLEQVRAFHWKPERQLTLLGTEIKRALDEVVSIRQEIHALAGDSTPEGQKLKAQRLFDANDATEKVRKVADVCVGSFFAESKAKDRLAERHSREEVVAGWLSGDEDLTTIIEEWQGQIRDTHAPFHWWLEFPEVFYEARPDPLAEGRVGNVTYMEAFLGNPPFASQETISQGSGTGYVEWLVTMHPGSHGACDLVGHFFRRVCAYTGSAGTVGLISTSSIAEGFTRASSLQVLLQEGWTIYDAVRSMPWPGEASVNIAVVHMIRGILSPQTTEPTLNGNQVSSINSRLRPRPERPDPVKLAANDNLASKGLEPRSNGFVIDPEEREALIARDPRNAERIFEYVGGADVNFSPTQSSGRYIINFGPVDLEAASKWPDLISIVEERVKPGRMNPRNNAPALKMARNWWQFYSEEPVSRTATVGMKRCLVASDVSKHLTFSFQPTTRILSNSLRVFALDTWTAFAVLQSRLNDAWARLFGSTFGGGIRYTISDCFEKLPFPRDNPQEPVAALEGIAQDAYELRSAILLGRSIGLNDVHNLLNDAECRDSDIVELRNVLMDMDRAVLEAYGWGDVVVPACGPLNDEEEAATQAFSDEIIDRLYVLNANRAAAEKRHGAVNPSGRRSAS